MADKKDCSSRVDISQNNGNKRKQLTKILQERKEGPKNMTKR